MFIVGGVIIPFLFPAFLGIETYGVFVRNTAIIFLAQRFIDISSEPILAKQDLGLTTRMSSLIKHYSIFVILFFVFVLLADIKVNVFIALTLFLSSFGINALFLINTKRNIIQYLIFFNFILFGSLVFKDELGISSPERLILLANTFGSIYILIFVFIFFHKSQLIQSKKERSFFGFKFDFIHGIGYSLFNLTISVIAPFLMSFWIDDISLGKVKLSSSIIFASLLAFPINQKSLIAIFSKSHEIEKSDGKNIFKLLKLHSFVTILVSLLLLFFVVYGLVSNYLFYLETLAFALIVTPLFIIEKYNLGTGRRKFLSIFNLIVSCLLILLAYLFSIDYYSYFKVLVGIVSLMYLIHMYFIGTYFFKSILFHLISLLIMSLILYYA